jgi:mRNA interferase MazF
MIHGERFSRGELWWAQFDIAYGSEAAFRRPVLIVQSNAFNESAIETIVVLPLTSNLNLLEAPGNVLVKAKSSGLSRDSVVLVPQFYAMDISRFIEKIGKVNKGTLEEVEDGIKLVLELRSEYFL